ncbi:MAG: Spore_germination_protein_CgeB, partial [uncultured Sphingomonas sp.]
EDRVLRIEPAVLLLERRRHLLPRPAPRPRPARPQRHLLRTRRLRPAAAPRHRAAPLGRRPRLPGDGSGAALRGGRSRRGRRGGEGERRRRLRPGTAGGRGFGVPPGGDPRLLGRGRARHPVRTARRGRPPAAPRPPVARPGADLRRRAAGGGGLRRLRRAPLRADLQRPRPGNPPPRSGGRPLRGRPVLPRQPAAGPRGAGGGVLPRSRGAAAGPALPDRRQRLGRQGDARQRAPPRPRLHARPQRLQHVLPRRAQHSPRQHGGGRLLAGDARVRGGRRRRLPRHRRLDRARTVPQGGRRGAGGARRRGRGGAPRRPHARARAGHRRGRAGAHPAGAHLRPARRRGGRAAPGRGGPQAPGEPGEGRGV